LDPTNQNPGLVGVGWVGNPSRDNDHVTCHEEFTFVPTDIHVPGWETNNEHRRLF
jgi:hypothetical protein